MKLLPRIGIPGIVICLFAGCGDRDDSILSIERSTRVVKAPGDRHDGLYGWEEMEGGLYRARFHVPPTFLVTYSSSGAADPSGRAMPKICVRSIETIVRHTRISTQIDTTITNVNRTVGAMLSGEIAKAHGHEGLPADPILG